MTNRPLILGPLLIAAILGTVVSTFWQTLYNLMVTRGSAAGAVVFFAFFAIIWDRRVKLSTLPIRVSWLGLAGLIGAGFVWLIGQLVFARILTDLAVIAMVPMLVLTLLGYRWVSALIFPLAFLLFALPMDGPLVPILVEWTARFVYLGIQASGVPIYREGAYFVIPTGTWEVADACSGIAYFSTCLMLGVLYAWNMYQAYLKRAIFVAGTCVVAIVGNWLRTYLTIMIAHLSDNRLLRDDHGTFGWVVFAILLFGYCWIGWTFRDVETQDSHAQQAHKAYALRTPSLQQSSSLKLFIASAVALGVLIAWPLIELSLTRPTEFRAPKIANIEPQNGWSRLDKPSVDWRPELHNPAQVQVQTFEKNGQSVDVFIGIFRNQTWASKLVTSVNVLVASDNRNWSLAARGTVNTSILGEPLEVKTGIVRGRLDRIIAWNWYWVEGKSTGSDTGAKILQLIAHVRNKDDTSAWIAMYTKANSSLGTEVRTLEEFMRDMGESLNRALIVTTNA